MYNMKKGNTNFFSLKTGKIQLLDSSETVIFTGLVKAQIKTSIKASYICPDPAKDLALQLCVVKIS